LGDDYGNVKHVAKEKQINKQAQKLNEKNKNILKLINRNIANYLNNQTKIKKDLSEKKETIVFCQTPFFNSDKKQQTNKKSTQI
jgi:hypothetical protein